MIEWRWPNEIAKGSTCAAAPDAAGVAALTHLLLSSVKPRVSVLLLSFKPYSSAIQQSDFV